AAAHPGGPSQPALPGRPGQQLETPGCIPGNCGRATRGRGGNGTGTPDGGTARGRLPRGARIPGTRGRRGRDSGGCRLFARAYRPLARGGSCLPANAGRGRVAPERSPEGGAIPNGRTRRAALARHAAVVPGPTRRGDRGVPTGASRG